MRGQQKGDKIQVELELVAEVDRCNISEENKYYTFIDILARPHLENIL